MKLINQTLSLYAIVLFCGTLLLSSCDVDDAPIRYTTYGIAYPVDNESYTFKIKTDNGLVLIPASNNYRVDTISRVYGIFSFVNEADIQNDSAEVKFNYLESILYKQITSEDANLENSLIYVRENYIWQSEYNDVLNIRFEFNGGGEKHLVNLYYNETKSNQDTVLLEFRHNDNNDPHEARLEGLVCFDLKSLDDFITVTDSIVYKITFNKGTTASFIDEWHGVYKPTLNE